MPSSYRVRLTENARDDLRRIGKKYGKKTYETIRDLIQDLEFEPDKKGETLRGRLHGLYSRHYSRFRIIYCVDRDELIVLVIATGYHENDSRVDVYKAIERMVRSGSIKIQDPPPDRSSAGTEE